MKHFHNTAVYLENHSGITKPSKSKSQDYQKVCIDDIVIASGTLQEHVRHLSTILEVLEERNTYFSPVKAFIGFPSVNLLCRRVNSLDLSTPQERAATIVELSFPRKLQQLEHWLGATGWF
ncbi:hypothetical protein BGW36DRAFT_357129 [Talaromyces proteolyticus]|uniref:Reverse transcriptase domain-containing protein n=1 Tax=Talaromyces proteolyticus TaxID=1131652 RepID=A0AAD4KT77_9EURO|nr:uncharacterized protein BGW36DRAFT_357129 [Talaromyces proteolyticus]KAH8700468.1 hypothetical protein BGW36DRAFT_357129 [Talaromyces proteolyticus]